MAFKPVDRLPVIEFAGWWDKTLERWHGEGLTEELDDAGEIREHLGLDCYRQLWMSPIETTGIEPPHHGAPIIHDEDDYRGIREQLYPDPDLECMKAWAKEHDKGRMVIWFTLEGFFWFPRTLLGIENHLYTFNDDPALMHLICRDLLDFNVRCLEALFKICTPDFMTFAEDMSYNHGPMVSKAYFDEFLLPYYINIVPLLTERGVLPFLDSDGDITQLIPWVEEAGLQGVLPLERMAGVDVAKIREKHPRFLMIGGFDKTVIRKGEEAMVAEFERLLPVMRSGGFIPSVDHQTPPDVTLEMYKKYVTLLKEYCAKAC